MRCVGMVVVWDLEDARVFRVGYGRQNCGVGSRGEVVGACEEDIRACIDGAKHRSRRLEVTVCEAQIALPRTAMMSGCMRSSGPLTFTLIWRLAFYSSMLYTKVAVLDPFFVCL